MRVAIEMSRGRVCCHSNIQQCSSCWKREMAEYLNLSEEAFEREWDRRISKGPDDVAQSFTIYELYGQDAGPKPESFYLQIEAGSR